MAIFTVRFESAWPDQAGYNTESQLPHNDLMAALSESRVSIRFFSDELDPDELTRLLACDPSVRYRKGDLRPASGPSFQWRWGGWIIKAKDRSPAAIDDQLAELFAKMTQDLVVWNDLASRTKSGIFCGLFMANSNDGFSISPATMSAIAARGLVMDFDIYSCDQDQEANGPSR